MSNLFHQNQNHIVHHLLTIYALGATPAQLQRGYNVNADYQRPPVPLEPQVVQSMHDVEKFKQCLGNEKHYRDYLVFFQDEIEKKGWENVLNEYVFKGDERADDLLVRLFAGMLFSSRDRFRHSKPKT
jgi:Questin oxidase-like